MVVSLWDPPFKRTEQHHWHYPAGQLHVWQNYFHSGWIFIIGQTTGARVCKGAVGCGDCGRSQALTAERVWNAKARLLPCAWRAAKEPGRLSPTERGIKNNLTRLHLKTSPGLLLLDARDYHNIKVCSETQTCRGVSCAGNNNGFLAFWRDFVMRRGFLHLLIPQQCRHCAGWLKSNVAADICLPSCHCTTVYNYSCGGGERVGGPDTLSAPSRRSPARCFNVQWHNSTDLLLLLDSPTTWELHPKLTHSHTLSHTQIFLCTGDWVWHLDLLNYILFSCFVLFYFILFFSNWVKYCLRGRVNQKYVNNKFD